MNRRLSRLGLLLALAALAPAPDAKRDRQVGESFQVPYRLTDTNHFLVRVRINGKGPFNFLVDTGAPALYVATDTAKKIGLEPAKEAFWTPVDRLDFEGGAGLTDLKARVEDPFQLVGMNALGLPGASIDGILGFTVLARFRLELDPTRDRMTWTRLAFEPTDPPAPDRRPGEGPPAEMQAMNLLGPVAKFAAALVGKQPEEELHPRGFLGLELGETADQGVRVDRVLADTPAAKAGIQVGDQLVRLLNRDVKSLKAALEAVAEVKPGDRVPLSVRRGPATQELTLTAGEGF
ncbi:PDZ domain-containing protein [Singulisphaera acidiphila]|uniref:Trypsin-like serine protease with C-terminal PDZ domain n=1 Tax=Singulisphaera acidiphila (strain ATCC BAA-1392 / DSM 18658 / VKM B-2454 / MOB10) TaxID=886293 RepID=L0D6X7_SINAD|nr:PDZ domain-containing protein [Singulisphaera acidiphila]AGA24588.1 trypsin-like serine protease with C-terminal PDZ domain [Singulisphaera acidiphila DSM 18658]